MKAWVIRNIFWILAFVCGWFFILCVVNDRDVLLFFFGFLLIFSIIMGTLDYTATKVIQQRKQLNPYDKAHYHQARRKTLYLVKGGKE